MSYHIYGIGNALVDKEFEVDDAFFTKAGIEKGMMTLIDEQQLASMLDTLSSDYGLKKRACGGSAANTIIGATYFGAKTFYTCNVASDETGDFYVADLKAAGVDTNMDGERDAGVTGKCLVMVTPDAERTMNTYLGITSDLHEKHINEQALAQSEYVYVEGYLVTSDTSRSAAIRVRELARQHGVKVAMTFSDPAMVQFFKDGLIEMLGDGVDLLFCNEQEAKLLADTDDLNTAVEHLKTVAKTFAITLGSKGALAFDGTTLHEIAPNAVTAVDSNGAGDMFAGAFLYAITHGYGFAAAGRLASAASAQVVSQFGPRLEAAQHAPLKSVLAD
ncbi:adenosine kinase [Thalassolituus marinus]|uniref:Adenosine kinase n=1 Tax=Thalassolituus marinus TaxID=671053 RepID=A0ABS7ZKC0_9GAMM|nr:adenosine kinase [Thalassolituus marinus]MCA6062152.1 adenosine kinase [Thalassolituus marinus]